jgi:hypothetical protein
VLTPPVTAALNVLFSLSADADNDATFGSDKARKAGETWDLNSAKAAEILKKTGVAIDPKDLSGKTTVVDVKKAGEVPCLNIQATLKAARLPMPAEQLPPGFTLDQSSLSGLLSGLFPVDQTLPPATREMTMEFAAQFSGKAGDGQAIKMTMTGKTTSKQTITPVK